ncbi:MAG: TDP-N-acetylfucosamine:lipid II N-acetylfucosaminyltransferase [Candidatus Magasanikbacteria bacterium]|nr:TDP-N-acetylfucosamine:lipid II N-acetylfucosaminyltransferase [Candidatus Magasanikbacteria bacterium]
MLTVHLMHNQKFIMPFINFVNTHFDQGSQLFVIVGGRSESEFPIVRYENVVVLDRSALRYWNILNYFSTLKNILFKSNRIIIHSLYFPRISHFLFINKVFLKKCYWIMWGGDFYFPEKQSWFKKQVIKKIRHFITYLKGDFELAQKWYGTTGEYHECFMYPSNLYKDYVAPEVKHSSINILVGNSADPSNNHLEVFDKLEVFKDQDIKIYAPLSYGNQTYAKKVIEEGKKQFGDKFEPLTDMMPFDQYLEFLGLIDVAIFNHKRQQAMGNTITLLSLGKKVFMRSDITPWELFEDIDVKVFDVENIKLDLLDEKIKKDNQEKIKKYFSIDNYKKQLQELFN